VPDIQYLRALGAPAAAEAGATVVHMAWQSIRSLSFAE
jgi:hypothetical protein